MESGTTSCPHHTAPLKREPEPRKPCRSRVGSQVSVRHALTRTVSAPHDCQGISGSFTMFCTAPVARLRN